MLQNLVPPPWGPPAAGAAGEQNADGRISITCGVREGESVCFAATQMLNARMIFFWGRREKILQVVLGEEVSRATHMI